MKKTLFTITTLLGLNSFAFSKAVTPCSDKQLINLESTIQEWKKDEGFSNIYYIKNLKGQILGYYSTQADSDQDGIHAEICDYVFQDDLTVSNEWYYWDQYGTSTYPSKWKTNQNHRISQDEGIAYFKVIKAGRDGNIKAKLKVVGWNDSQDEIVVRSSVVLFEKKP